MDDLLDIIQTTQFTAHFTVIDNFEILLREFGANETIRTVINSVAFGELHVQTVIDQCARLLDMEVDQNYQHPFDMSIAVHLYILSVVATPLAYDEAHYAKSIVNLWWGMHVAKWILGEQAC